MTVFHRSSPKKCLIRTKILRSGLQERRRGRSDEWLVKGSRGLVGGGEKEEASRKRKRFRAGAVPQKCNISHKCKAHMQLLNVKTIVERKK